MDAPSVPDTAIAMSAVLQPAVTPFAGRGRAAAVSLPIPRLQPGPHAHLVALGPFRGLDAERAFEDFAHRHIADRLGTFEFFILPIIPAGVTAIDAAGVVGQPAVDTGVPGIGLIARLLRGGGFGKQRRIVKPPDRAFAEAMDRFGPDLITVAGQRRDVDGAAA